MDQRLPAIDCHAHVFHQGLALAPGRRYAPTYDASLDAYLAMLDFHGFVAGVLVQPSFLGTDNSFLLDTLARAPHRLRGIAVVAPDVPLATLQALARAGITGLRLNLMGIDTPDIAAQPWPVLLREAAACGFHIEVQAEAQRLVSFVPRLLETDISAIVIDHFGLPDPDLGVDDPAMAALLDLAAQAKGRLWMKLSASYRVGQDGATTAAALIPRLTAAFGIERLVFGTDWPHTRFEDDARVAHATNALAGWFPAEADRRRVGLSNAAALFGFSAIDIAP